MSPCYPVKDNPIEYHKTQLVTAIVKNDADRLRSLLHLGGIDFVDCTKSTLIHFAIDLDKPDIVDVLLETEGAPLDIEGELTADYGVETPLLFALRIGQTNIARKLIEKGADLNFVDKWDNSALYYCFVKIPSPDLELAKLLIEKGASVNYSNSEGKLLLQATYTKQVDAIHMLLYYGTDVPNPTRGEITPFDVASPEIKEILFDYIFYDDKYDMRLKTLVGLERSLLQRIEGYISDVWYLDDEYEELLHYEVQQMDPYCLKLLMEKFNHAIRYILKEYSVFQTFSSHDARCVENFSTLVNSNYSPYIVKNINKGMEEYGRVELATVGDFVAHLSSQREGNRSARLLEFVTQLVKQGVYFDQTDVGMVFLHYGFCPLFKYMIMDPDLVKRGLHKWKVLIAQLIYNVNMSVESFFLQLMNTKYGVHTKSVKFALELFCDQRLKNHCLRYLSLQYEDKVEELPEIPLLVELARNVARQHLINFYKVTNFKEFSEVLEKLSITEENVKVLTFEKKLYKIFDQI